MPVPELGLAVGTELPDRVHQPDEVDLFRYSAALWLAHRIHYDAEFARAEGHRGPVVHGPLQGAYLVQLVEGWLAPLEGRITDLAYRHHRTAFAGDRLVASGRVLSIDAEGAATRIRFEVELIRGEDGTATTTGSVEALIPGSRRQ